jgi:hypothetical protein
MKRNTKRNSAGIIRVFALAMIALAVSVNAWADEKSYIDL